MKQAQLTWNTNPPDPACNPYSGSGCINLCGPGWNRTTSWPWQACINRPHTAFPAWTTDTWLNKISHRTGISALRTGAGWSVTRGIWSTPHFRLHHYETGWNWNDQFNGKRCGTAGLSLPVLIWLCFLMCLSLCKIRHANRLTRKYWHDCQNRQ